MRVLRRGSPPTQVVLVTRQGCHLCEEAEPVVRRVAQRAGVAFVLRDVDEEPELQAAYTDKVPVVLLDGVEHAYWRIDERALKKALRG